MSQQLPQYIDPVALAKQGRGLSATLEVAQMSRLQEFLASNRGEVTVALQFDRDDEGCYLVQGQIDASLHFVCQRCGQAFERELRAKPCLQVITQIEQAKQLGQGREPLWLREQPLALLTMVEEELLLALPMVIAHDEPCHVDAAVLN